MRNHDKGFLIRKGRSMERHIVETRMKQRRKVIADLLKEKVKTTDNAWFSSSEFRPSELRFLALKSRVLRNALEKDGDYL